MAVPTQILSNPLEIRPLPGGGVGRRPPSHSSSMPSAPQKLSSDTNQQIIYCMTHPKYLLAWLVTPPTGPKYTKHRSVTGGGVFLFFSGPKKRRSGRHVGYFYFTKETSVQMQKPFISCLSHHNFYRRERMRFIIILHQPQFQIL